MPSLKTYQAMTKKTGMSAGQALFNQSNKIMESLWDTDSQSKVAYLYDYYHDNDKNKNNWLYDEYNTENKFQVDIKHILDAYDSLSKDSVAMYVQFKPSEKLNYFNADDEMYYYQTDYSDKYNANYPVGLYMDIPDKDMKVIRRYLVCKTDVGDTFVKYYVLECDYKFQWIEEFKGKRIKREMWGCTRSQSSYNSGLWSDDEITTTQDQEKILLPLNPITEYININHPSGKRMRVLMGAPTPNIRAWEISKMQDNQSPERGVKMITLYQHEHSDNDYINVNTKEFFADYYSPTGSEAEVEPDKGLRAEIVSANSYIKMGGSYKTLTLSIFDAEENNVTTSFTLFSWSAWIDGVDVTSSETLIWLEQEDPYIIKLKLRMNPDYLGNKLTIKCDADGIVQGELALDIQRI